MITPVNGHILIEPIVKNEGIIVSQQEKYQEIGVVLAVPEKWNDTSFVKIGDKVYFDAWLAAKFPSEKPEEFLWLVKWEDVRAVEYAEPK